MPRLTQGAFRMCLDAMFTAMTGRRLEYTLLGKPSAGVFGMARQRLEAQMGEILYTITAHLLTQSLTRVSLCHSHSTRSVHTQSPNHPITQSHIT